MDTRDPDVTPQRWNHRGEAVVRNGQRELVVFGGIPGEHARVRLIHSGFRRSLGSFVEALGKASPHRIRPQCSRYILCGACPLMHLDREGQQRARLAILRDALAAEGLEAHTPTAVESSPDGDIEYRYSVKLAAGRSDRGRIRLGALSRGSRDVVTIPGCIVATPELREVMSAVSRLVIVHDIWPYDQETQKGLLRYVLLRQSRSTGQILVTLVAAYSARILRLLADEIMQTAPGVTAVHAHLNDQPGNAILAPPAPDFDPEVDSPPFRRLAGADAIEEEVAGVRLTIGPGDFFQVNPGMAERIVRDITASLEPFRERPVVDLYCGVGVFALALGELHGWSLGVETMPGAAERARANARLNRTNAEFISAPSARALAEVQARVGGRAPVVMVDPARKGLEDGVIDGILAMEPAALVYLSCGPRSLARDLASFTAEGWRIDSLRAYDMFPQTAHVETLALLSPPAAPSTSLRAPQRRKIRG